MYLQLSNPVNRDGLTTFKVLKAVYGPAEDYRLWFLHLTDQLKDCLKANLRDINSLEGPVISFVHIHQHGGYIIAPREEAHREAE